MDGRRSTRSAGPELGGGNGGAVPSADQSAVVWRVATSRPDVALTFDDGPDPRYTPAVLALLAARHAVATFFVLGQQALRYPQLVQREVAAGSEVCNHGYSHVLLRGRSPSFVRREVMRAARVLGELGLPRCPLFRFPYFASDATARRVVAELGYRMVGASVDPQDWRRADAARMAQWVCRHVRPGDIILLHDAGGPRESSVVALGMILRGLAQQGLQPVTVSRLLASGVSAASAPALPPSTAPRFASVARGPDPPPAGAGRTDCA